MNEHPPYSNSMTIALKVNYENKSLDDLKEMRKNFNLKEVRQESADIAYLCRMIDFLIEKVEKLENE